MTAALELRDIVAGYGETVVLDGLSLAVKAGGSLAVLGRNGVGKTTLLSTIVGHTRRHRGQILFNGRAIESLPVHARVRLGVGLVPQERDIFKSLTLLENLQVAMRPGGWSLDQVFDLFPSLVARRGNAGNRLSGGEQQMLAVARALVGAPQLLLLDEPMEGLAPIIVESLFNALKKVRDETGMAIVLVEQKAELALRFADEALVLDRGRIVHQGPSGELLGNESRLAELFGMVHD